jgi:hypothetical protein
MQGIMYRKESSRRGTLGGRYKENSTKRGAHGEGYKLTKESTGRRRKRNGCRRG